MSESRHPIYAIGDCIRHGTIVDIDCDGIEVVYLVTKPIGGTVWVYEEHLEVDDLSKLRGPEIDDDWAYEA